MFHAELLNTYARAMTEERIREMQNLREARRVRAEERARRRRERRERHRLRRSPRPFGRAV